MLGYAGGGDEGECRAGSRGQGKRVSITVAVHRDADARVPTTSLCVSTERMSSVRIVRVVNKCPKL